MNLIFATTNRGKLAEAQALAEPYSIGLDSPQSLFPTHGNAPNVIEDADSYLGNAQKKAAAFFSWCKRAVVADDSGLEVEALNRQPGVLTARFAGEHATDQLNRSHLLHLLEHKTNRNARIHCVLFAQFDSDRFLALSDSIEVQIATAERGTGGFGYDPVLLIPSMGLTLAEIKQRQLQFDTHRVRAFKKLFSVLERFQELA